MLPKENRPNLVLVVIVTAPDIEVARKIARAALEARAAACANLLPQIESHYWWEGKIESAAEVLILFKTTVASQESLLQIVRANHPYKVPEFVALQIDSLSPEYEGWVRASITL